MTRILAHLALARLSDLDAAEDRYAESQAAAKRSDIAANEALATMREVKARLVALRVRYDRLDAEHRALALQHCVLMMLTPDVPLVVSDAEVFAFERAEGRV